MKKYITLASASPRRKELLAQVGLEFDVLPSDCEEVCEETAPDKIVQALARLKAVDVAKKVEAQMANEESAPNYLIIGADTIVAKDGQILGKPADEAEAFAMLQSLQGDTHEVYSGVALVYRQDYKVSEDGTLIPDEKPIKIENFAVKTTVAVFPMTEEQIKAYIATGEPMDKAGAYGIQGAFAEHIAGIEGDYYNVVGLPVSRLMQRVREIVG